MEDLVSIIIPVYNVAPVYLSRCIGSALEQTYANLELILVDDGSTLAEVGAMLEDYSHRDPHIKLYRKENEGVALTRKFGVDKASGEYLFFMDCDDRITPDAISSLYRKAKDSGAEIVIGDHYLSYEGGKNCLARQSIPEGEHSYLKALLSGSCGRTIWNKLFRREIFEMVDIGSAVNGKRDNDVQINFLIARSIDNSRIVSLGSPSYYWVQRGDSATRRQIKASQDAVSPQLSWVNSFVNNNFSRNNEISDYLAYFNLKTLALVLNRGMSLEDKELEESIYSVYWKNRTAKARLRTIDKIVIIGGRNRPIALLYSIYRQFIKPLSLRMRGRK